MRTFSADSTNVSYARAWHDVTNLGARVPSRNGDTMEVNPGIFEIPDPSQRLITCIGRPVNVAFALAEVLWILSGRRDVDMVKFYNRRIDQWSDNGEYFNAPYGYRLRTTHGFDQIEDVIRTLTADPGSRQAILNVWDPQSDRGYIEVPSHNGGVGDTVWEPKVTADRACNVLCHLMIRDGKLNWLQVVRSNDLIWGVPYNFMQWMHVMEYIARRVGVPLGHYVHVADSLHVYDFNRPEKVELFDLYQVLQHRHAPMTVDPEAIRIVMELEDKIRKSPRPVHPASIYAQHQFIGDYWRQVLLVLAAHRYYKENLDQDALMCLLSVHTDPVYGLAQTKFYWQNRWSKMNNDFQEKIQWNIEDYLGTLPGSRFKVEQVLPWMDDELPE